MEWRGYLYKWSIVFYNGYEREIFVKGAIKKKASSNNQLTD